MDREMISKTECLRLNSNKTLYFTFVSRYFPFLDKFLQHGRSNVLDKGSLYLTLEPLEHVESSKRFNPLASIIVSHFSVRKALQQSVAIAFEFSVPIDPFGPVSIIIIVDSP